MATAVQPFATYWMDNLSLQISVASLRVTMPRHDRRELTTDHDGSMRTSWLFAKYKR